MPPPRPERTPFVRDTTFRRIIATQNCLLLFAVRADTGGNAQCQTVSGAMLPHLVAKRLQRKAIDFFAYARLSQNDTDKLNA